MDILYILSDCDLAPISYYPKLSTQLRTVMQGCSLLSQTAEELQRSAEEELVYYRTCEHIPIFIALQLLAYCRIENLVDVAQQLRRDRTIKNLDIVGNLTAEKLDSALEELEAQLSLSGRKAELKLRWLLYRWWQDPSDSQVPVENWKVSDFLQCDGMSLPKTQRTNRQKRLDIIKEVVEIVAYGEDIGTAYESLVPILFAEKSELKKKVKMCLSHDTSYTKLCGRTQSGIPRLNAAKDPVPNAIKQDIKDLRNIYKDNKGIST
ncbi:hypothetical protein ACEN3H_13755 [Acinetobacter lactucae]|uniref:hypothetical protein n=1 Tax=Acinetobacter lactucae TaxID=1785128 RepID=UPI00358DB694